MTIFGVGLLIGMLVAWAKIFRFGLRLPLPNCPEILHEEPRMRNVVSAASWEQFGNFSNSNQCIKCCVVTPPPACCSVKEPSGMRRSGFGEI